MGSGKTWAALTPLQQVAVDKSVTLFSSFSLSAIGLCQCFISKKRR